MKVIVSRDDAWKLDNSMFLIDGSWETGYTVSNEVLFMVGVTDYCEERATCSTVPSFYKQVESLLSKTEDYNLRSCYECLLRADRYRSSGNRAMSLHSNDLALRFLDLYYRLRR